MGTLRTTTLLLRSAVLGGGLLLSLAGCNNSRLNTLPATNSEVHYQGGGAPPVDVLFVVDNSGSMANEQQNLGANFQQFISYFQALGLDYHLGVTTTDDLKTAVTEDGTTHNPGEQGKLVGNPNILTPQTQNVIGDFTANVNVGIAGWRAERGLESAKLALSNPMRNGANAGFLRDNAILAIIIVSDEEDQSKPYGSTEPTKAEADDASWQAANLTPVADYVNFFLSLKNNNQAMVNLSAIIGDVPGGCPTSASPGTRYAEAATMLHGVQGSICADNFGPILDQIGATVTGLATAYPLQFTPDPSTITVTVDGTVIPMGPTGWTYNAATNTISFAPNAVPPSCAVIQIDYGVADYGNGIVVGNNEAPPVQCGVTVPPGGGNTLEGGTFSCDVTTGSTATLGSTLAGFALALGLVIRRRK